MSHTTLALSTASQFPAAGRRLLRPSFGVESLALLVSLFFATASNAPFWRSLLTGRTLAEPATWGFAAAIFVALVSLQFVLICLVLTRWIAKPLLALLIVTTASASYYMSRYAVLLDPPMLRNVLHTHWTEARELLTADLVLHLLWQAVLPIALLWRVRVVSPPWKRAVLRRVALITGALIIGAGSVLLVSQDFMALIRNQRELRYLITPGNYIYSLARVARADARAQSRPREPIGLDAKLAAGWQQRHKPVLFVMVVGETARAANWGLNGYERQTTPELKQMPDVLNFATVSSCGTDTETSVPCLFSPWGRRQYDEDKIRGHQSLLHVLDRAGFKVLWRDNQSGCKGVCEGLQAQQTDAARTPELCSNELCFDEAMLKGLDSVAKDAKGNLFVVLHQLGNHGPSYYLRYPQAYHRYAPTCDTAELGQCTHEQIVNSYDNALLYTDHFVAQTIRFLQAQSSAYDTAMIYVSDHGESLGENHLFLHGVPYAIAPDVQTRVPMVAWFSQGYAQSFGLDMDCMRQRSQQPAAHDNLFHSVLGLLDVQTSVLERDMDMTAGCRH